MSNSNIRHKLHNVLAGWFPAVPENDYALLERILTYNNIFRLRIIAWLMIAFMIILIIVQLIYQDEIEGLPQVLEIAPLVIVIRFIFIAVSICFLIISRLPASPDGITTLHGFYQSGFILLNLTGFAILSGLIHSAITGIASSYIMAMLVSAAFIHLNWSKSILIYSLAWAVMSFAVWWLQPDWVVAFSAFLNGSFATFLALVISRLIYISRVTEFLSQQMIETQKEELAATNGMLKRLSYLDALTNIPNRRYFDEFLSREWRQSVRENAYISSVMIDIDSFKVFNDTFGHQAGDNALVQVATALGKVVKRPGDLVARYGGEEFVVILPDTDQAGASHIAERMRRTIEGLKINHPYTPSGHLTISLGLACVKPKDGEPPEKFIDAADKALYKAKDTGGNRCVWADFNQ